MLNNNELKKRIISEQQCMKRITNNDLVCKDCMYKLDDSVKLGNTSTCNKYEIKPGKVLLGDKCDEYKSEFND